MRCSNGALALLQLRLHAALPTAKDPRLGARGQGAAEGAPEPLPLSMLLQVSHHLLM